MQEPVRIVMWSGPRNISTAMMRAFENRTDTAVIDEPFYVPFLAETGIDHPMRDTVMASRTSDPQLVIAELLGPVRGGKRIFYQKHMTHHMLPQFPRAWMTACQNAFLIRAPEQVLASYAQKRIEATAADIGFMQQRELFEREADRLGSPPPVIDAEDVLVDPRAALTVLCGALCIPFSERMLHWPAGPRGTDGAWAPVWYGAVERSTGFAKPERIRQPLSRTLQGIADAVRPHYDYLAQYKLAPKNTGNA
jgi:hypothetical protein